MALTGQQTADRAQTLKGRNAAFSVQNATPCSNMPSLSLRNMFFPCTETVDLFLATLLGRGHHLQPLNKPATCLAAPTPRRGSSSSPSLLRDAPFNSDLLFARYARLVYHAPACCSTQRRFLSSLRTATMLMLPGAAATVCMSSLGVHASPAMLCIPNG